MEKLHWLNECLTTRKTYVCWSDFITVLYSIERRSYVLTPDKHLRIFFWFKLCTHTVWTSRRRSRSKMCFHEINKLWSTVSKCKDTSAPNYYFMLPNEAGKFHIRFCFGIHFTFCFIVQDLGFFSEWTKSISNVKFKQIFDTYAILLFVGHVLSSSRMW